MTVNNQKQSFFDVLYLTISRCFFVFWLEHPLEFVKGVCQSRPNDTTIKVVKSVYSDAGFKGFYNTCGTNFPRRLIKESFRWPLIHWTHKHLISRYPKYFQVESVNSKIATATVVALFNSVFVLPIERLMNYRIKENKRYRDFFKVVKEQGVVSFHQGFKVNMIREISVWGSFFVTNHLVKAEFDKIDQDQKHPYLRQFLTSNIVGGVVVGCCLPIDFVKTRIQMDLSLQSMKTSKVVETLYRQYKIKGFYSGGVISYIHTLFHATICGLVVDKIFSSHQTKIGVTSGK